MSLKIIGCVVLAGVSAILGTRVSGEDAQALLKADRRSRGYRRRIRLFSYRYQRRRTHPAPDLYPSSTLRHGR